MRSSLIQRAAFLGAAAFGLASNAAFAQSTWTTLVPDQLNSFSFVHAHHPDGRFLFGTAGTVRVQDSFGANAFTPVNNSGNVLFDPSFIAVRSASSGLIGGGGFFTPSGLFGFDPSTPSTPINVTALATLQNYNGIWWKHPSSGREGWLIGGGNSLDGAHNLTFISADGAFAGPVTTALSSFSGGLDCDAAGHVFAVLADWDPTLDNLVLKFDADQIDAAVHAILSSAPAPLHAGDAAVLYRAAASGALAVDAEGRVWVGGYQIDYLQAFDPATGIIRRFYPHPVPPDGYVGPPTYAPKAFRQGGVDRLSFLANDGYYVNGTDLILGHAKVEDLIVRSVQFTASGATVNEGDGSVSIAVSISPAPDETVTIPLVYSGTATPGEDFATPPTQIVFDAGETVKHVVIDLIDDAAAHEPDETLVITLGAPLPEKQAGLGVPATDVFTLVIQDNDAPPVIARQQAFPPLQVGAFFTYPVQTTHGTATRWRATGLPPGLSISAQGVISGIPTAAGEFDRVILTASNAFGATTSIVFLLPVAPLPAAVVGAFSGLVDRSGAATGGLGARLDLTTTAGAAYTARLRIGKKSATARGSLIPGSGQTGATASFSLFGQNLSLTFDIDDSTGDLSGHLAGGGDLAGFRHAPVGDSSGLCHFSLFQTGPIPVSQPEGAGFGSLTLPARGRPRSRLVLPDNTAITQSSSFSADGHFLVYQTLYRNPGSLLGFLNVADDLARGVTALDLTWSKPDQSGGVLYRDGWTGAIPLQARGGKYRAPAGATLPLDALPSAADNARLVLQDGGIDFFGPNPLEIGLRILEFGKWSVPKPLRITVNPRTGALGGRLPLGAGATARTAILRGLLIPDETTPNPFDATGQGFFILPTQTPKESRSGLLLLERVP